MNEIKAFLEKARFFLDERFPDLRDQKEIDRDLPKSYFNCFPSALFLERILKNEFTSSEWKAVHGKFFTDSHAFVYSKTHHKILDLTADQFGEEPVLFQDYVTSQYWISEPIHFDHPTVSRQERDLALSWIAQWENCI